MENPGNIENTPPTEDQEIIALEAQRAALETQRKALLEALQSDLDILDKPADKITKEELERVQHLTASGAAVRALTEKITDIDEEIKKVKLGGAH